MLAEQPHPSRTYEYPTGCGRLYVHIVRHCETRLPITVFCQYGKSGGCTACHAEVMCRLITQAWRAGGTLEATAASLNGMECVNPAYQGADTIRSCADAMARALLRDADLEAAAVPAPIEPTPATQ
jgi:ribonucleoside-diphosphate reductase alpha chain